MGRFDRPPALASRIRLGTAVCVLPLYQPPRVLAEIAMVDTLSHGRLDQGSQSRKLA